MTDEQFLKKFEELLEVDPGEIGMDTELSHLSSWDSLTAVGFLAMANSLHNVVIAPSSLVSCITVRDLFMLVEG